MKKTIREMIFDAWKRIKRGGRGVGGAQPPDRPTGAAGIGRRKKRTIHEGKVPRA
jgi:hypothetical protein